MFPLDGAFRRRLQSQVTEGLEVPQGWFAISHLWVEQKIDRRAVHGKWFRLENEHRQAVFRALRFSPNLQGTREKREGDIVIDWPAWIHLSGQGDEDAEVLSLRIRPATLMERLVLAGIRHPDPTMRLSFGLALLSLGLGLVSLLIAIILSR